MDTDMTGYYCLDRNRRKAAASLKGILHGVVADKEIAETEVMYLDVWLRSQEHLKDDPDAVDLIDAISDVLADGVITSEEELDLRQLIDGMLEFWSYPDKKEMDRINEFVGISSGVIADGKINNDELVVLMDWMDRNPDLFNCFPVNLVVQYFNEFKSESEEDYFLAIFDVLKKVSGVSFNETGSGDAHPLLFIEDDVEGIDHNGKRLVVSGGFDLGDRDDVHAVAESRGYINMGAVSGKTDYLVFGSRVSPDWSSSSFGRKIEKAVKLRAEGKPIKILSESQWLKHLGYGG